MQAQCLQDFEQVDAIGTVARAQLLGTFAAQRGYCGDADYSVRMWLVNKTRVTKGCAAGHIGWSRHAGAHPRVAAAMRAAEISVSWARTICQWTVRPDGADDTRSSDQPHHDALKEAMCWLEFCIVIWLTSMTPTTHVGNQAAAVAAVVPMGERGSAASAPGRLR